MLQTLRIELAGTRGGVLASVLCALLAAPVGCSSSDAPPPAPPPSAAPASQAAAGADQSVKLTKDQLEALVAPIALYPDPLLAQCLVASTYPIDVVAAQQWLAQNSNLKGDELAKAAEHSVPCRALGTVRAPGTVLSVEGQFDLPLDEIRAAHTGTLPALFG